MVRTFLIADIRGYTRFTQERGDEAAAGLATRFAEIVQEGVEASGGELVELRGDEALAVFASARRAIRAAVELQEVLGVELDEGSSVSLGVGMGLDAGEAVPVADGYRGGALNLAARLCARAGAGEVLASQGVIHLARTLQGIHFEPLAPLELKGLAQPVQAVRVALDGQADQPPRPSGPPGRRTELSPGLDPSGPLVGREGELRWLRWSWRRARNGHGRVVSLIGPSGIGKTRLAAELAREVHAAGWPVLHASCAGPAPAALEALGAARSAAAPTLVVADDLDRATGTVLDALDALLEQVPTGPIMVIGTHRDDTGSPLVSARFEGATSGLEHRRRLESLGAEAVGEIASFYIRRPAPPVPMDVLLEQTDGVPGLVHRWVSEWARKDTAGRLSAAATQTAAGDVTVQATKVLPGPLRLSAPFPFVGRSDELAALTALLPVDDDGLGRVALVGGKPGSGKTRLVRELAHTAVAHGVTVLYGACDAVVNAPYQPFAISLGHLVSVLDDETLRECVGPTGGELTRLLPELVRRLGPLPGSGSADPDTERYRLHAGIAELLIRVSELQPMLLVVDDVQWADVPSLHLVRHLAATSSQARLLLLGTFRDREPQTRPEFSEALADLLRTDSVVRLRLSGLGDADVVEFVRRSTGASATTDVSTLAHQIRQLTGGNPFLLCELWRTLIQDHGIDIKDGRAQLMQSVAELGSPDSVRDVVQHRLARLLPTTTALLDVAAVIGPEFDLGVLGEAAGIDDASLGSALEEAVRSGMLDEVPGPYLVYRFAHELVRRALYDRLPGIRRAQLHLRVGETLEHARPEQPGRLLPELAHHFSAAASQGGIERAVEYNLRAAEAAVASLAYHDAAARLITAVELGVDDQRRQALIHLDLGVAQHRAGQTLEALAAFRRAAAYARDHHDDQLLARAAIGFEEACWRPAIAHDEAATLLEEATRALGPGDSSLKARTLAWLSRALAYSGAWARAARAREEAVAMARRLGDHQALAAALLQAWIARGTLPLKEVLAMLTEARELGEELGDPELVAGARAWAIVALFELCDLEGARRETQQLRRAAEQTRQPFPMYTAELHGSAIALCDGRLAEAEAMAQRAWAWSRHMAGPPPSAEYGLLLFSIRREQGRLAELKPLVDLMATQSTMASAWRPGLTVLLTELGMHEAARTELSRLRADKFASIRHDGLRTAALTYLTDTCAALGDVRSAPLLYQELEPLAGGNLRVGQAVACYGAADRYLGMLSAIMGNWDTAQAHFEDALALNRRMGAHTWTAHTAYQFAHMLRSRGCAADQQRADELIAEASGAAERFGLTALGGKLQTLGGTHPPPDSNPAALSARELEVLGLLARGRTNRQIGQKLFISEHTAANHIRNILRKTGCANRTDAAAYAHRHGLVNT
jgi:class 3 adenylate cyclase/DNA-binding CsgD family transcriptional regulator/tetratricopeptide (TPR) repeat protein